MRSRTELMLIEGPQAVRELLRHRAAFVRDVYLTAEAVEAHPELLTLADAATQWVHEITPDVSQAMSGDAQGAIAVVNQAALTTTLPEEKERSETYVLIAQGRDPGNVGTIIRTADAMGASAVLLCAGSVDVKNPKVIRSSVGSVFHLPILTFASFEDAAHMLHLRGVGLLGTTGNDETHSLSELVISSLNGKETVLTRPHAWVMGNEARGLAPSELSICDTRIAIPMTGAAESLNVASAA
ncbi:MAG: RNA methyltransferase, partial [Actinobacteria bacterium]